MEERLEEIVPDPRETLAVLLSLRLGRASPPAVLAALQVLDDTQVVAVRGALNRPAAEALPLMKAMLNMDSWSLINCPTGLAWMTALGKQIQSLVEKTPQCLALAMIVVRAPSPTLMKPRA